MSIYLLGYVFLISQVEKSSIVYPYSDEFGDILKTLIVILFQPLFGLFS